MTTLLRSPEGGGKKKKEIMCPGRQQAEVGGCLETAQAIVLTAA